MIVFATLREVYFVNQRIFYCTFNIAFILFTLCLALQMKHTRDLRKVVIKR